MEEVKRGVLIDTWWNVNTKANKVIKKGLSFNRYMVECKYRCSDLLDW